MLSTHFSARAGRLVCVLLFLSILFIPRSGRAVISKSGLQTLQMAEDSLIVMADSMFNAAIPDAREEWSQQFAMTLVRALRTPSSYEYPFPRISERINIIAPDDKAFRIFNWVIAPTEVRRRYYGAVQAPGEALKLYGLVDCSEDVSKGLEDSVFTGGRWFGALYYRIMPTETAGGRGYLLFGRNEGLTSNRKVIDPIMFTRGGVTFGAPVFGINSQVYPGQRISRFVMEYKLSVQASLNWDDDVKAIVFDRLVSEVSDPNRKYTYVPSGQYDGFRWDGQQWRLLQDIMPLLQMKDGEAPVPMPETSGE